MSEQLSVALAEALVKGAEHDRRVRRLVKAIKASDADVVAGSREVLPEVWAAIDAVVEAGKRAPAYYADGE